jgi:hypothetical protein
MIGFGCVGGPFGRKMCTHARPALMARRERKIRTISRECDIVRDAPACLRATCVPIRLKGSFRGSGFGNVYGAWLH